MSDQNDGIVYGPDGSVTISASPARGGRNPQKEN
jgi:hypothetical protein